MPTAIENIILRYIKSKADWWCSYVSLSYLRQIADIFNIALPITTVSESGGVLQSTRPWSRKILADLHVSGVVTTYNVIAAHELSQVSISRLSRSGSTVI